MKLVTITLNPLGKLLRVRKGTPLVDVLQGYGAEFPCGGKGRCGKCAVRLLEGTIPTDPEHQKKLQLLGLPGDRRLACMSTCEEDLVLEADQFKTIILADESLFEFEPREGFGVAVDLGTTTIVAQLLDLLTGRVLAVEKGLNPQRRYGHDLVSRLEWALEHGVERLQGMVRDYMGDLLLKLMEGRPGGVDRVVLVGNTVMQHLFCGSDIRPLSFYPFNSKEMGSKSFSSSELGWRIPCGEIRFYPSIGSFVGSDVLAGILATGMHLKEEPSVLVDLGTNGEIAAGNRQRILCASTAAGPAFEGARISMGMTAVTGAISSVERNNGGWSCRVIGNTEPRGICGSGLIDAVAVLMQEGYLDTFGTILSGEPGILLAGEVNLSQKDIQEFLLAKAAIAAGLDLLLERLGLQKGDIAAVYLAGAFGTYINSGNVSRTGMIRFGPDRLHQLGNTALMGAKMLLYSDAGTAESILGLTAHVNLESDRNFQERFVSHLQLDLSGNGDPS